MSFWQCLVLKLQCRGACAFKDAYGALNVQRISETVVGVDDHRTLDPVSDGCKYFGYFGHRHKADVRSAKAGVGDGGAGKVYGL